jgi:phosphatidate cytidylyltransferase
MLKTRVLTGVIFGLLMLGILLALPPIGAVIAVSVLVLIGALEWSHFLQLATPARRWIYVEVIVVLAPIAFGSSFSPTGLLWLAMLAGVWWFIAFAWICIAPHRVNRLLAGIAGLCVLVPAWALLARVLMITGPIRGSLWVLWLLAVVAGADVGAYFVGRTFGRLALAPRVSPNKTWEGLIGGLICGVAIAVVGAAWLGVPRLGFLWIGLVVVLASAVGDLTESLFKRYAGLKDSGQLLPGHGGVLDRIDALTAAVPFFVLGLIWFGFMQ